MYWLRKGWVKCMDGTQNIEKTRPCCRASFSSSSGFAGPSVPSFGLLLFFRPFGLGAVKLVCDMAAGEKLLLHFLDSLKHALPSVLTVFHP